MASRYWVVSLPVQQNSSTTSLWSRLQESISRHSFDTPLYRFNIPNLRVGTLDSLLALSDDLVKSNTFIEGVCSKTRRQIEELERVSGVLSTSLTVDGVPVDSYLTRFAWDEAKYPTMSPLKEIVDGIHSQVAKIEDDLKVRVSEYSNVRSQLNAINRKQTGRYVKDGIPLDKHGRSINDDLVKYWRDVIRHDMEQLRLTEDMTLDRKMWRTRIKVDDYLAVRDLSNLVKPEDVVTSEHLTTLLAVVSKYSQKDWLSSYETLTTYVVPRSSKMLYEDNEYALYTVTLFNRDAENFKIKARERGFQIRDFEHNPETQESRKQELEKLMQDQETFRSSLLQWCYTSYGETSAYGTGFTFEMLCSLEGNEKVIDFSSVYQVENSPLCYPATKFFPLIASPLFHPDWPSIAIIKRKGESAPPSPKPLLKAKNPSGVLLIRIENLTKVFSSWMHFCAVRIFAESILRYGLPPSFLSVVLAPSTKSEKKVRSILESVCDSSNSNFWKAEDEGGMAGFGGDTEAHPYVSFTINLV
ncbi:V-type proton ATPase subunit C [Capsicum annuum]|nr:V-type proton ATPase subunit C [Capsicum annuum]